GGQWQPRQVAGGKALETQRQIVQLGSVEALAEHPAPVANQSETQQSVVQQEVVGEMRWHRGAVEMLDPVPELLQQRRRLQRQLADLGSGFAEYRPGDDGDGKPFGARMSDVTDRRKPAIAVNLFDHTVKHCGVSY